MNSSPAPSEIREQLGKILASTGFAPSERLCRFLRFSVEAQLKGEADQLKEFLLGREVFDRNAEYDPRLDPIVRVEARRLRTKLSEYYEGPGRDDRIRIDLPKGGYAPEIRYSAMPVPEQATVPEPPKGRFGRRTLLAVAICLVAIAGAVAVYVARRAQSPAIAVIPASWVWNESNTVDDEPLAEIIAAELANQGVASVPGWPLMTRFKGQHKTAAEIAASTGCSQAMIVALRANGGESRVTVFLLDAKLERKRWVGDYPRQSVTTTDDRRAIAQRVARDLAARR